jgi:hypothetical protein
VADDDGDGERWVPVGRAATKEEVRDQLVAWCQANGWPWPPPADELRWHHGLAEDGEYWDVWARVAAAGGDGPSTG